MHPTLLHFRLIAAPCIALAFAIRLRADTVLETETAELGAKGTGLVSNSVQFEKDRDGKTAFTLTQFEYGITDRCEILIEPFFHEWIRPKGGPSIHGMGDIEITPSYMIVLDKKEGSCPA